MVSTSITEGFHFLANRLTSRSYEAVHVMTRLVFQSTHDLLISFIHDALKAVNMFEFAPICNRRLKQISSRLTSQAITKNHLQK